MDVDSRLEKILFVLSGSSMALKVVAGKMKSLNIKTPYRQSVFQ